MASSLQAALEGAELLFADCPAFQTRVGAADSNEAKAHIYFGEAVIEDIGEPGETLTNQRPLVVLNIIDAQYDQFGVDDTMNLGAKGGILVQIQDVPGEGTDKQKHLDFADFVGQVIDWISQHVGSDQADEEATETYFPFRRLIQTTPINRGDLAARQSDDFFMTEWLFQHEVG